MTVNQHALSIDVEDWSNASILLLFKHVVPPSSSVVDEAQQLLALLAQHATKATFFFLGEIAEYFPSLIRQVAEAGHEIGVHGYYHYRLHLISFSQLREQLIKAKNIIEQTSGRSVVGFRAPAFSVHYDNKAFFELLIETGFEYDSSVFPFKGRRYGDAEVDPRPHQIDTPSGRIWEVPPSVIQWGRVRLPCCGGGYLRHFPLWYTKLAMRHLVKNSRSAVVYLHPYELQTTFDRGYLEKHLNASEMRHIWRSSILQYRNRHKTAGKLAWLLRNYRFGPIVDLVPIENG